MESIPGKQAMPSLTRGILDMTFVRFGFPLKDSDRSLREAENENKAIWGPFGKRAIIS